MLSIASKGTSIPILFSLLPKGSSSQEHRIQLIGHYIRLFGKHSILKLIADREFIGEPWLSFLWAEKIKYIIRMKDNSYAINCKNGKRIKIKSIFNRLPLGKTQYITQRFIVHGNYCYLSARRFTNRKGKGELIVLISFEYEPHQMETYGMRWQIETMFKAFKSSGFNIEDTHLRKTQRFQKLLCIVMIAFTWAYITGIYCNKHIKQIRVIKHLRQAKSFFKYGLEFIAQAIMKPNKYTHFNIAVKILSCT